MTCIIIVLHPDETGVDSAKTDSIVEFKDRKRKMSDNGNLVKAREEQCQEPAPKTKKQFDSISDD